VSRCDSISHLNLTLPPCLDLRFPQVSGIYFSFDQKLPAGSRIPVNSVSILGSPVDLNKLYRLCTTSFIAEGKDGYDVFKDCKVLVEEENGLPIQTAIRNHFRFLSVLSRWDPKCKVQKFARSLSDRASARLAERKSSGGGDAADQAVEETNREVQISNALSGGLSKIDEQNEHSEPDAKVNLSTRTSETLGRRKLQTSLSMQYQLPEINKGADSNEYAGLSMLSDGAYVVAPTADGRINVLQ
jgi:hypothetical protein